MSTVIYLLTNTINNKIYIGQSSRGLDQRWAEHCQIAARGSNCHIHRAIRKHGVDAFVYRILEHTTIELVNDREKYWIDKMNPEYNMTKGGEGSHGRVLSPETRRKISNSLTGKTLSTKTRQKMSATHKGRKKSDETRAKMSIAQRSKVVSDESRAKMSISAKLRCARGRSPETQAKMNAAQSGKNHWNYGKKTSQETRNKIRQALLRRSSRTTEN